MKKTILALLALGVCSSAFAQTGAITYRIEKNFLSINGVTYGAANRTADGFNITVYTAAVSQAAIDSLSFSEANAETFLEEIKALGSNPAFGQAVGGWATANIATGPVFTLNDWSLQRNNLTTGLTPIMLVVTNPLGSLTTSDYVALVSTNTLVGDGDARTINFTGIQAGLPWNNFILGSSGSLVLAPIPEPSTYAAIFGFLALGAVVIRRRLRK